MTRGLSSCDAIRVRGSIEGRAQHVPHAFDKSDICIRCQKKRCPKLTALRVKCAFAEDDCIYHNPKLR